MTAKKARQDMGNRILLVGSEKGGVGKTTLAFNLAVLRVKAGKPVLLVDTDRQASSSMWASLRAEAGLEPPLVCVQKHGKVGYDLVQLKASYEVIVDAGGQDSVELRQAIAVADQWLIPVKPSQLDLFSMAKMRQLKADIEERAERSPDTRVVLNAVSSSTTEGEEARAVLADDEALPLMACQLTDRVAMRRAVMAGCAVTELTGKSASEPANTELLNLYEELFGEPFHDASEK